MTLINRSSLDFRDLNEIKTDQKFGHVNWRSWNSSHELNLHKLLVLVLDFKITKTITIKKHLFYLYSPMLLKKIIWPMFCKHSLFAK